MADKGLIIFVEGLDEVRFFRNIIVYAFLSWSPVEKCIEIHT